MHRKIIMARKDEKRRTIKQCRRSRRESAQMQLREMALSSPTVSLVSDENAATESRGWPSSSAGEGTGNGETPSESGLSSSSGTATDETDTSHGGRLSVKSTQGCAAGHHASPISGVTSPCRSGSGNALHFTAQPPGNHHLLNNSRPRGERGLDIQHPPQPMPEIHPPKPVYESIHFRNREESEVSILEVPHRRSDHAYIVPQTYLKPQSLDFSFLGLQSPEQDSSSSPLSVLSPFTSTTESDSPFRSFGESPEMRPIAFSASHTNLHKYSSNHLATLRETSSAKIRPQPKGSMTQTISEPQLSTHCELKSAFDETKLRSSDDLRPLASSDGHEKMGAFNFNYSSGDDSVLSETPRTPDIAPEDEAPMDYSIPLTPPSESALESFQQPSKTQDVQEVSPLSLSSEPRRRPSHQPTGSTSVSTTMLSFLSKDKRTAESDKNGSPVGSDSPSQKNILSIDDWSQKLDEKLKMDDCFTVELKTPVLKTIPEPPSPEEQPATSKKGLFSKSASASNYRAPQISGPTLVKKNGVQYNGPEDPIINFSVEHNPVVPITQVHSMAVPISQLSTVSRKTTLDDPRFSVMSADSIGEVEISEIPSTAPPPPPPAPLCVPPPLPDMVRTSVESHASSFYSVNSERQRQFDEGVAFNSIAPNIATAPKEKFTTKLKRTFGRKPKRPSNQYEEDIEQFLNQKTLNTKRSLMSHLSSDASTYSLDNTSSRSNVFSRMKPRK